MSPTSKRAFGQVLKGLRLERGLTQEELSYACNRHSTYIRRLERGKSSPTLVTVDALAKALGMKPSEILRKVEKLVEKKP